MGRSKRTVPALPKPEGDGYMLSAFMAREFGFGQEMTAAELANVNNARQRAHKDLTHKPQLRF